MEGIGMMPDKIDTEKPDEDAVSLGLLNLAHLYFLEPQTRRQRFRAQVLWLKSLWVLRNECFRQLAHKHAWVQKGLPGP
jgi:hypothetical protein